MPERIDASARLSACLEQIATVAKRLNKLTDESNETVRQVEAFLEACSLGVSASVHCVDLDQIPFDENSQAAKTYLVYTRAGGKFRIGVTVTDPDQPHEAPEFRLWSSCDRETKLETIKYLPSLLAAMAKDAESVAARGEAGNRAVIQAIQGALQNPKR